MCPNLFSFEPPFKELASATLQLASIDELALKLEITIDANDEQLLKFPWLLTSTWSLAFSGEIVFTSTSFPEIVPSEPGEWVALRRSPNLISA